MLTFYTLHLSGSNLIVYRSVLRPTVHMQAYQHDHLNPRKTCTCSISCSCKLHECKQLLALFWHVPPKLHAIYVGMCMYAGRGCTHLHHCSLLLLLLLLKLPCSYAGGGCTCGRAVFAVGCAVDGDRRSCSAHDCRHTRVSRRVCQRVAPHE